MRKGQALTELLLVIACILPLGWGAIWLGQTLWERMKCVPLAFKTARAALNDHPAFSPHLQISDDSQKIRVRASCRGITETVQLNKMEQLE